MASETSTYDYDALNRLTRWTLNRTPESYTYDPVTGNLDVKAGVDLNYNDAVHKHAVTHIGTDQRYWYDANGNQTKRIVGPDTYDLTYDAENRLSEVKKNGTVIAAFTYDGDGNRVKSVIGTETTVFIGAHYEVTNPGTQGQAITKYYFAGATRVAMRKYVVPESMQVEYFLGDHLGSTSITTDSTGAKISEIKYKPWGEIRSAPVTPPAGISPAYKLASYTFTGQFSYMDDPNTGLTEGFGLMFYQSRWYDPYITQFSQPDTIVPDPYNSQDWNRYAYARNNPIRYTDPTGHMVSEDDGGGTLENTLKYFKEYGKHKDKFNDYYATIYFAEQALAESVSGGITDAELKILVTYDDAIQVEYNRALKQVSQESFTLGMPATSRTPLALRAGQMGFGLLPEMSDPDNKTELLMALFPTSISILKHIFRDAPGHFAEDTAINRALMTDTVQNQYFVETDIYGNQIYARQLSNGTEIWVEVRNGMIRNGGLNELPRWTK